MGGRKPKKSPIGPRRSPSSGVEPRMEDTTRKRSRFLTVSLALGLAALPLMAFGHVLSARKTPLAPPHALELAAHEDAFELGMQAFGENDLELAIQLWLTVPDEHPQYAKAQRFIGWEIYTERLGDPLRGLAFVNRAATHAPFDGNVWQDWSRTYAALAGLR